ncbi:MAG: nucleotidyltransferase [Clostridiaceae bacterium]|jgi:NDP-sugar pyrophosphorylase family protein|nr:nucleotidyltransferase [Clostridiaceae bacterium]
MDTNKTALVVMAAGMGSRFGGLKQIEPIGQNGETILDFSLYDAKKAGFSNLFFVINKKIEKDFRNIVGKKAEKQFDTTYVFQEIENVPKGFVVPPERQKPWGTAHAVLQCADKVDMPFTVINADDFYGQTTYKIIHDHLVGAADYDYCMAGFLLKNTLTEHGTVARGICEIKDGYLKGITERTKIQNMRYTEDGQTWVPLHDATIVSMNFWGFTPTIFGLLEKYFLRFLKSTEDKIKSEYFLPYAVDMSLNEKIATVRVLKTDEKWYGVTYKEDLPFVREGIKRLSDGGLYG